MCDDRIKRNAWEITVEDKFFLREVSWFEDSINYLINFRSWHTRVIKRIFVPSKPIEYSKPWFDFLQKKNQRETKSSVKVIKKKKKISMKIIVAQFLIETIWLVFFFCSVTISHQDRFYSSNDEMKRCFYKYLSRRGAFQCARALVGLPS